MPKDNLTLEEKLRQGLVTPGTPFPIRQTVELNFDNQTLNQLKESSRQFKLTESKGGNSKRKLLVTVEGIHTGMTKNRTFYPGSTLEASVPTWTTPHPKPVLKNHNEYTEPLGRIIHAEYTESTLTDKYTVRLKLEITDQDAIEKILDGRYLTLSVGGSANRVNCSVCGKDLVQEGYCGHARGRKYDGKEAYWVIGEYTGDEISFVNVPADVHAQVIAAELVSGEGGKTVEGEKQKEHQTSPKDSVKTNESVDPTSIIDNLLNNGNGDSAKQTESSEQTGKDSTHQQESQSTENAGEQEQSTNPTETKESNESDAERLVRLQSELEKAQKEIKALESKLEEKDAEITALTAQLSEEKDAHNTTKKHLNSAETEKETLMNQNIALAKFARKALAERVADLRIMQGKNKFDEREALIAEWSQSSTKVLESQINDLLESGKRHIEKVTNPGLAVPDKNSIIEDDKGNEIVPKKKRKESVEIPTMKTFEQRMKSSMLRTVE